MTEITHLGNGTILNKNTYKWINIKALNELTNIINKETSLDFIYLSDLIVSFINVKEYICYIEINYSKIRIWDLTTEEATMIYLNNKIMNRLKIDCWYLLDDDNNTIIVSKSIDSNYQLSIIPNIINSKEDLLKIIMY